MSSSIKLYGGDLDATANLKKNILTELSLTGNNINLGQMAFLESMLGAPLQGLLNMSVDVNAKTDMSKDGTGYIRLNLENIGFGPGVINLPAGGFVSSLTVPSINLGKMVVDLALDKGQIESKTITLAGGDVEADLKVNIALGKNAALSKLDGTGWFSIKREFINSNDTLKMLFDLIPELRAGLQGDGKIGLSIKGTLARPQPRLERYVADKAVKKEQVADR